MQVVLEASRHTTEKVREEWRQGERGRERESEESNMKGEARLIISINFEFPMFLLSCVVSHWFTFTQFHSLCENNKKNLRRKKSIYNKLVVLRKEN